MEEKDLDKLEDRFAHLFEEVILDIVGRIKDSEKNIDNRIDKLDERLDSLSNSIDSLEGYVKELVDVLKEVIE
ncbi:hypothetical protein GOQ27_15130 [Clostridium sp. D2Q-11]|uniref:Uncharacterized protein n=1 Tax=Anaeromonas frigoriresistens TaxID=2683708 RepID=A0A942V0U1_9FIRM|nr:hypothetical protein [Anaeromonas frigoriresistens]MBS4539806.1 hypothetical protein [Anaeromonas frigoriresistens]